MGPTALLDACVLFSAPLRDLLVRLAAGGLCSAKWTDKIHDEWTQNLLRRRPDLDPKNVGRTRSLMNAKVNGCLVTDYEDLVPSLTLPDPDDRHVLAAAIQCGADVIVTFNLTDFPADVLSEYEIEALHPDDFVAHLIDTTPDPVCMAVKAQREALKNPPKSVEEHLEGLVAQGLTRTVALLRPLAEHL